MKTRLEQVKTSLLGHRPAAQLTPGRTGTGTRWTVVPTTVIGTHLDFLRRRSRHPLRTRTRHWCSGSPGCCRSPCFRWSRGRRWTATAREVPGCVPDVDGRRTPTAAEATATAGEPLARHAAGCPTSTARRRHPDVGVRVARSPFLRADAPSESYGMKRCCRNGERQAVQTAPCSGRGRFAVAGVRPPR